MTVLKEQKNEKEMNYCVCVKWKFVLCSNYYL